MKLIVLATLLGYAAAQCVPEVFYVHRHAERFQAAAGNGQDDAQEVLTQEGVNRAASLAAKYFTERLPLQAIFVTEEYIRSRMTDDVLFAGVGITSITRYPSGINNGGNLTELTDKIAALDPCPTHIDVVTHGNQIRNVFVNLGFDFDDVETGIGDFGQFFHLINDGTGTVIADVYGNLGTENNQPWPGLVSFPAGKVRAPRPAKKYLPRKNDECVPELFYVHRHAERFISAAGNGVDDAQEVLTLEGIQRSFALRNKFLDEQLPLEAGFVSEEYIRSYLTAGPNFAETGITSVTRYNAQDPTNDDLVTKIAALDPCPAHIEIVTHGAFIRGVFAALGFDPDVVNDIAEFGQFFFLVNDDDKTVIQDVYGEEDSEGNQPWPGLVVFPPEIDQTGDGS